MQVTEKPTQKGNLSHVGISLGVGGSKHGIFQALVYFSKFPLVLSSFSLRVIVSSENMTVCGEENKSLISDHSLKAFH